MQSRDALSMQDVTSASRTMPTSSKTQRRRGKTSSKQVPAPAYKTAWDDLRSFVKSISTPTQLPLPDVSTLYGSDRHVAAGLPECPREAEAPERCSLPPSPPAPPHVEQQTLFTPTVEQQTLLGLHLGIDDDGATYGGEISPFDDNSTFYPSAAVDCQSLHASLAESVSGAVSPSSGLAAKQGAISELCKSHLPLEPLAGSSRGGMQLCWLGAGEPPAEVRLCGRPCAAIYGGIFVAPMLLGRDAGSVDVTVEDAHGQCTVYPKAFEYWLPGHVETVEPSRCPQNGGAQVSVSTTDLGAAICAIHLDGVPCEILGQPSAIYATFVVPARDRAGEVRLDIFASNGNQAIAEGGVSYYAPMIFGAIGDNVELSADAATVTRKQGVNRLVCLGAFPLPSVDSGRYFELRVEEAAKNIRALAVGVAVWPAPEDVLHRGFVKVVEARSLDRSWLIGYDRGGALFVNDGSESKVPASSWRPANCLHAGSRIGVLWSEEISAGQPGPSLVVFQDGVERVRLPVGGRLPQHGEELVAVVDIQGSARSVSLLPDCQPPLPPAGWEVVTEQM